MVGLSVKIVTEDFVNSGQRALPLVGVVTPATLTIQVSSQPNTTILNAPIAILDYSNLDTYGRSVNLNGNGDLIPSSDVSRILLSVASQGSLLTLPAPFPNSSYAVEFYGPTISCGDPKNETFTRQVGELIQSNSPLENVNTFVYVGFVPSFQGSSLPGNASNDERALNALWWTMDGSKVSMLKYLDQLVGIDGAVTFYVAVPSKSPFQADKPIVCQLYNSSYTLNYTFNNGQQDVRYETKKINTVGSMNGKRCDIKDPNRCNATHAYLSMMGAMGHFLRGTMFRSGFGGISTKETQVKSSVLMETKELQALNEDTSYSSIGNISMSDALEELFTNFTISMFSNQRFTQNKTAATPGPITYSSTQNEFAYEPRNLFIAYGVGLLLTLIIVIAGLLCIKSASVSYGSSFSTILRTTRNPDLDTVVPAAETSGAEPLSKHLGNIRLVLRRQGGGPGQSEEEKVTFFAVESKSSDTRANETNTPAESLLLRDKAGNTETSVEGLNVDNR